MVRARFENLEEGETPIRLHTQSCAKIIAMHSEMPFDVKCDCGKPFHPRESSEEHGEQCNCENCILFYHTWTCGKCGKVNDKEIEKCSCSSGECKGLNCKEHYGEKHFPASSGEGTVNNSKINSSLTDRASTDTEWSETYPLNTFTGETKKELVSFIASKLQEQSLKDRNLYERAHKILLNRSQKDIAEARKEVNDSWINQKANDHDNRIRQSVLSEILAEMSNMKKSENKALSEGTNEEIESLFRSADIGVIAQHYRNVGNNRFLSDLKTIIHNKMSK